MVIDVTLELCDGQNTLGDIADVGLKGGRVVRKQIECPYVIVSLELQDAPLRVKPLTDIAVVVIVGRREVWRGSCTASATAGVQVRCQTYAC
jgi:hypothetical protein